MKVVERKNAGLFDSYRINGKGMTNIIGGLAAKSHAGTVGDCEIDSGDVCDYTTIDPDCPPATAVDLGGGDVFDTDVNVGVTIGG